MGGEGVHARRGCAYTKWEYLTAKTHTSESLILGDYCCTYIRLVNSFSRLAHVSGDPCVWGEANRLEPPLIRLVLPLELFSQVCVAKLRPLIAPHPCPGFTCRVGGAQKGGVWTGKGQYEGAV
jgi:hypothetical protein